MNSRHQETMHSNPEIDYLLFQHYIYHLLHRLYDSLLACIYGGVFWYLL